MQTIKCKQCGKVLFEAEGDAKIIKDCPKCKCRNEINIENTNTPKFMSKIINKI
jgi:phage FluMu protein Com